MRWSSLSPASRERLPLLLLDTLGCAAAACELAPYPTLTETLLDEDTTSSAQLWFRRGHAPAPHAALLNGVTAHHADMDDGDPRASLHGGVTIFPAAMALAQTRGASGEALLLAAARGYSVAVACGRTFLAGIEEHALHPPAMVGCLGAAAAAASLLELDDETFAGAVALAGSLMPLAPFDAFTRGAAVKDLYGGWPAFVGVQAAELASAGLRGPNALLGAEADGVGTFLLHRPVESPLELDPNEVLHAYVKPYATCRAVQPALTALETLLPIESADVESVLVETYPFAVEQSGRSKVDSPIGAKLSIPYAVATLLEEGRVDPGAFSREALGDQKRRDLASRVQVRLHPAARQPGVRTTRIRLTLSGGERRSAEANEARWGSSAPALDAEIRGKFRRLAGSYSQAVEHAVDRLVDRSDVAELARAVALTAPRAEDRRR